jgi:FkbM family methyltransferase
MRDLRRQLGRRVQSLGAAVSQPGRLTRKLTGVHLDEDVMCLASRRYVQADRVSAVLDVGANHGQFARTALAAFPNAAISCFEPLPSAQATLEALAAEQKPRVRVFPFALGDRDGSVSFNVTSFSPSSSALPIDAPAAALAPQIELANVIHVPQRRLQDWAATAGDLGPEIVLKLDVQGYEGSVLRGAGEFLRRVRVVIAETIFAPLYKGQTRLGDLCAILEPLGFGYREAFGVIRDDATDEPQWQDSVFVRAR